MRQPKGKSRTDWERVKHESEANAPIPYDREDGPYDPNNDAAVERYWKTATIIRRPGQRGPQKAPTKQRITIRLSQDIVEHFRAEGVGWQTRMDEALREWLKSGRKKSANRARAMKAVVGIWKDRTDIGDTEKYVRNLRKGSRMERLKEK
jgi:uncharacterized protein (DUF4415 family)